MAAGAKLSAVSLDEIFEEDPRAAIAVVRLCVAALREDKKKVTCFAPRLLKDHARLPKC